MLLISSGSSNVSVPSGETCLYTGSYAWDSVPFSN